MSSSQVGLGVDETGSLWRQPRERWLCAHQAVLDVGSESLWALGLLLVEPHSSCLAGALPCPHATGLFLPFWLMQCGDFCACAWGGSRVVGSEADKPVTSASGPCSQALWTPDGAAVVYPCHAVIVVLHIETREQRLFLGHTEKVGSPGLGQPGLLARTLPNSLPPGLCSGAGREWLAAGLGPGLAPQHASSLGLPDGELPGPVPEPGPHPLLPQVGAGPPGRWGPAPVMLTVASVHSFSSSGELLCGVGKDRHGRTVTGLVGRWGSRPRVQAGGRDPRWPPSAWPGTPTSHTSQGICLALVDGAVL